MTVSNVNALLNYAAGQTTVQTDQAGAQQEELVKNSFDQIMTKVNDAMGSLRTELAGNATLVNQSPEPAAAARKEVTVQNTDQRVTSDSDKAKDALQQSGDNDKVVENADTDTDTDAAADEIVEEVEQAGEELIRDIAKEMDVTVEEVEEVLEILGLTAVQLFDISNLREVLLAISGSTDELSLVTDETLYGNLQNLTAAVEENLGGLQEALGLGDEELDALLGQLTAGRVDTQAQDAEDVDETMPAAQETEPEVNLEGMKDYTVSVQRDGGTVRVKVTVDDASGSKSMQEEVTDTPKTEVQGSHKLRERNASADSGRGEGSPAGHTFMQTLDKAAEVSETPESVSTGYQSVQTEDIMNQIMDYMKINLKADVQEMELQLHPASLGTVNVQIAAKDGAITAQFTTQNETVRAVIETQLIQLKNQFEEQGIKVDAVEVTVANHEYGQQFSQDNGNAEQKQNKTAKSARRINLDELGEETELEELEESERIAVEMMQASGSTVDYTA